VQKDHPPLCKMDNRNIGYFNKPKNSIERRTRKQILKELPNGEWVGIIHGEHNGHVAKKLYCVGAGMKVRLFDNEIYIPISQLICDEIYEAVRVRCELSGEEFCPLPF